MKKPPTRDGLVGLLFRASGRTLFVLTRRIALVLQQRLGTDAGFREKSHETGVFDRLGELALIFRGSSRLGPRHDFAIGVDEFLEQLDVFIVDVLDFVLREVADLLPRPHFLESHVSN